MGFCARQGDVLIKSVDEGAEILKAKLTEVEKLNGKVVLALGETTGHMHQLLEADATMYLPEGVTNVKLINVPSGGTLVHDEHKTVILPPGKYEVIIQTEFQDEDFRLVVD